MSKLKKHLIKFIGQIGKIRTKKQNNKTTSSTTTRKSILSQAVLIFGTAFLTFALSVSLQAILASEWVNPTAAPPASNVEPPINEGDEYQPKLGGLSIGGGLGVSGDFLVGKIHSLYVDSSSVKVGIGTTSPQHLLHLYKTDGNNAELDIQSNPGMNNHWAIYNDRATNQLRFWKGNDRLTITKDGNVGIGATNPGAKLDVAGQIIGGFGAQTTGGTLDWNNVSNARSGSGYTLLKGNATNGPGPGTYFHPFNFEYSSKNGSGNITQFAIPYGATSHMNSGLYMRGRYSGTWSNWMRIIAENNSGNVGIGTTNPAGNLTIYKNNVLSATAGNLLFEHPTSGGANSIAFTSRANHGSDYGYITYYDDNNNYNYWGNSSENSALVLGVQNDGRNSVSDVLAFKSPAAVIVDSGELLIPSGKVGIGTTNPGSWKLYVNGGNSYTSGVVRADGGFQVDGHQVIDNNAGWHRAYGNAGFYFQNHGGGWYMTDSTWIRSYGNKSIYQNTGTLRTDGTFQVGPSGNRFLVKTNGKVGIGTTNPTGTLDVISPYQHLYAEYVKNTHNDGRGLYIQTRGTANKDAGGTFMEALGVYTGNGARTGLVVTNAGNVYAGYNPSVPLTTVMNIVSGNVGIGTTNPQAKLEVNGRIKAGDPIDNNDVATKGYVDAKASESGNRGYYGAYVTSKSYNGNLGGRSGADAKCNSDPNKPSCCVGNAWAFLSVNHNDSVRDFIRTKNVDPSLPWLWVKGNTTAAMASDWVDLWKHKYSSTRTYGTYLLAQNLYIYEQPWTGTRIDGYVYDNKTCNGWTTRSYWMYGGYGSAYSKDNYWIEYKGDRCVRRHALYCVCKCK